MKQFVSFDPKQWQANPFTELDDRWMLITAKANGRVNTMTASWGGFGVIWNKNTATAYVRTTRFTRELMDVADTFSLTFFDKEYQETLRMLGTLSGRDSDKMEKCGLTVTEIDGTPVFEQAHTAIVCKKLYRQLMERDCMVDKELYDKFYSDTNAPHYLYIGEIIGAYSRA
ncbi:MAG: flavin reductase family protein [Clostridia bacterium]|nr:flavin reductase family protein [Clostridia bacterium]